MTDFSIPTKLGRGRRSWSTALGPFTVHYNDTGMSAGGAGQIIIPDLGAGYLVESFAAINTSWADADGDEIVLYVDTYIGAWNDDPVLAVDASKQYGDGSAYPLIESMVGGDYTGDVGVSAVPGNYPAPNSSQSYARRFVSCDGCGLGVYTKAKVPATGADAGAKALTAGEAVVYLMLTKLS